MTSSRLWTAVALVAGGVAFALGSPVARAGDDAAPPAPTAPAPKDKPAEPPKEAPPAPTPEQPTPPPTPADPKAGDAAKKPEAPAAPAFTLKDLDGKDRTLEEFKGKWVVLEWVNPGCPFVRKFYAPGAMQRLQSTYTAKGVVWLSVCSTNPAHKDYKTAEQWKAFETEAKAAPTAVLLDPDGSVGRSFGAMRTPEFRIICPKGTIRYVGAIDDDSGANADPSKARNYVAEVLDAVLAGKDAPLSSAPAYGCGIKYSK